MSFEEYPRNLEMFSQQKYIGKYLDVGSREILIDRAKAFGQHRQRKRGSLPYNWRFSISQEHPLTFIKNDVNGYMLQIDVSCETEGKGDDINKHNVLLRVWSLDEKISFREGLDAIGLKTKLKQLEWKRVILRFHFDLRTQWTRKPEPLYHFHVGGNPKDDENCWIPKQIKVPRFPYLPMDLILLCELVLVNFFPKESEELRKKPEWKSFVRKSQELFQKPYLNTCIRYLDDNNDTLLGNLVSSH